MSVIRSSRPSIRARREEVLTTDYTDQRAQKKRGAGDRWFVRDEPIGAPAPVKVRPMPGGPFLGERPKEEQDQRDQQHVDDERLDQHEAQDERAADVAGRAGIAGDRLGRRADGAALTERRESRGKRQ